MIKILFVCHGNICRSPMAEFIMKDMAKQRGIADTFYIASAATSREEIGNPVYPPAQKKLRQHGITTEGKYARQMTHEDYDLFDYLIGMEQQNITNMLRIVGSDSEKKICRLLDYSFRPRDIADPWYTDDFDLTYHDILEGCTAFLDYILNDKK
jgi:protein-tyrosine phosphatase